MKYLNTENLLFAVIFIATFIGSVFHLYYYSLTILALISIYITFINKKTIYNLIVMFFIPPNLSFIMEGGPNLDYVDYTHIMALIVSAAVVYVTTFITIIRNRKHIKFSKMTLAIIIFIALLLPSFFKTELLYYSTLLLLNYLNAFYIYIYTKAHKKIDRRYISKIVMLFSLQTLYLLYLTVITQE